MKFGLLMASAMALLVCVGCGGDSDGTEGGSADNGASRSGDIVNRQPPGQAKVTVEGKEFTFTESGAVVCSVSDTAFSFSFRIGDNETTLGAGSAYTGGVWRGAIQMTVANPAGEPGPVDYLVELAQIDASDLAIDGKSLSYSGAMLKQSPRNSDGSVPPAKDVGEGTVSVTCK